MRQHEQGIFGYVIFALLAFLCLMWIICGCSPNAPEGICTARIEQWRQMYYPSTQILNDNIEVIMTVSNETDDEQDVSVMMYAVCEKTNGDTLTIFPRHEFADVPSMEIVTEVRWHQVADLRVLEVGIETVLW